LRGSLLVRDLLLRHRQRRCEDKREEPQSGSDHLPS
jgi:hypothetical protein